MDEDFNPLAPCGARRKLFLGKAGFFAFQSSRPVRGETTPPGPMRTCRSNFNPLAPCGARRHSRRRWGHSGYFNPLAPCGARQIWDSRYNNMSYISILSPRAGRDGHPVARGLAERKFQSSRPVRGETRGTRKRHPGGSRISILSPRAGRDCGGKAAIRISTTFQSSRPVRGETAKTHNLIVSRLRVFDKSKSFSSA